MNPMSEDPFPSIPPPPRGLNLHQKRRWVNDHGEATELWRLRAAEACDVEWMQWCSTKLDDVCDACQEADGKPVRIGEFDVLGHRAACTCPDGCGCICGPAHDPCGVKEMGIEIIATLEETTTQ